jgi:membrane-associated phospholipid phosphatase
LFIWIFPHFVFAQELHDGLIQNESVNRNSTVAAALHNDSTIIATKASAPNVKWTNFILPAGLITYGVLSLHSPALQDVNEDVYDFASAGPHTYKRPYVEDYLMFAPGLAVFGMNLCGLKGNNSLGDAAILYGLSNLVSSGVALGVKNLGIETRPDGTDDKSFPSGHTTTAFVNAEFMRFEYTGKVHWSVIATGYLVAGTVGYMRMYHNRHWFGDIVAGAGIGMAGTRFSYFLYPHLKRWITGGKKDGGNVMLLPTYTPGGAFGLAFAARF